MMQRLGRSRRSTGGKVSRRGHQHPVVRTDVADGQAAVRQITDANAHIQPVGDQILHALA